MAHVFAPVEAEMTQASSREQAAVLAIVAAAQRSKLEWHRAAALIEEAGSAERLIGADPVVSGFEDEDALRAARSTTAGDIESAAQLIDEMRSAGASLTTVLDDDYPLNLRFIFNRPPFLFVRGRLSPQKDARAIAVVGTREASPEGLEQTHELARDLAQSDITVLSGLAAGIDSAAHRTTLENGGRTIAVMGTGIAAGIYPRANARLAEEIVERGGSLVSQFWPKSPPARWSFPMRNVVMSGMALGTVVIEASKTSGAKMQARLALEHGKRVFLVRSLVLREEWAQRYAEQGRAVVVENARDVARVVDAVLSVRSTEQLQLA